MTRHNFSPGLTGITGDTPGVYIQFDSNDNLVAGSADVDGAPSGDASSFA